MRKCKLCKAQIPSYAKSSEFHEKKGFCCIEHCADWAIARGREISKKAEKKKRARKKAKFYENDIKTRRDAAIREFNRFIRLRDAKLPCISCGAPAGRYKLTAGHFITAGSCTALRFDEKNVHGQCWWNCNKNKSGNIVEYRKGLIERFGQDIVDYLESPQPIINITAEWYKVIEDKYKAKCKELELAQK